MMNLTHVRSAETAGGEQSMALRVQKLHEKRDKAQRNGWISLKMLDM